MNKRYADRYDRLMGHRIMQRIAADMPLQSHTDGELQADALPVTRDPRPKPCKAWVRYGPHPLLVDALLIVWNDVACGVEFSVGERRMRCWVWANAVTSPPSST